MAVDGGTVREVLAAAEAVPRRAGAVLLVGADGRLSGILTDADLRRRVLSGDPAAVLDGPVRDAMHAGPRRVRVGDLAGEALAIMNELRIDELPVVDADDRPVGLLDVQDLVGLKALNHAQQ